MNSLALEKPLLLRLWTYQAERFPLAKHGVAIGAFALAGAGLPALIARGAFDAGAALTAFALTLLFFMQLRIADEHKDFADDLRFRPERPVQRGLVSLAELRAVAIGAALAQAAIVLAFDARLIAPLILVWLWMALMTAEFFAPCTLKARPVLYLMSHMAVTPLIALVAIACGWARGDAAPHASPAIIAFLALAFANGLVVEISRKCWAPAHERTGVESYSRLWGPRSAALALALAIAASLALCLFVLNAAQVSFSLMSATALFAAFAGAAALSFALMPTVRREKALESAAGLFVLASYALIALAPWLETPS